MRNRAAVAGLCVFGGILFFLVSCGSPGPDVTQQPPPFSYPDGPSGAIAVSGSNPQPMTTRFGQNYWCWSNYGDQVQGTESLVTALKLNVLRAGGYNNDANTSNGVDPFDYNQIDTYIAYSRAVGAEPILQVSLLADFDGVTRPQPSDAAAIVNYTNVAKGYGVKYWEIGNEPDIYSDQGSYPGYTVNDYANDFNRFSQAMRQVDASIKFVGPDLAWKYFPNVSGANDWLAAFLTLSSGNYDVVSVHRYPFDAQDSTIANALADAQTFSSVIQGVRADMAAAGLPPNFPLAVTEANISWDGDPSHSIATASPQTFFAGLWVADNLSTALQLNLWSVNYWSLSEGWTTGFIDATTKLPKPSYYGFQMISNHVGTTLIQATPPQGFSVYASRNATNDTTILIVINKNATNNSETIVFSGLPTNPTVPAYKFPAYSLTCLTIPDNGSAMSVWSYTQAMAADGQPPERLQ
ncbi:MAG TPA: hypothetical protein VEI54_06525 [Candidatus Limnocylindrales bacterium]|nr:hypothetical protein [Candidatus Limnocylindrales bacterium]